VDGEFSDILTIWRADAPLPSRRIDRGTAKRHASVGYTKRV
jgi:hypothetical protein